MVLVKFKPGVSEAKAAEVMEMIGALRAVIPGITGFEWGRNNSPEGWNKGLTHAFLMTFESAKHRDVYLPHPEHEKVKTAALQHVEDACILDFGT
jgi:hypothetical protein